MEKERRERERDEKGLAILFSSTFVVNLTKKEKKSTEEGKEERKVGEEGQGGGLDNLVQEIREWVHSRPSIIFFPSPSSASSSSSFSPVTLCVEFEISSASPSSPLSFLSEWQFSLLREDTVCIKWEVVGGKEVREGEKRVEEEERKKGICGVLWQLWSDYEGFMEEWGGKRLSFATFFLKEEKCTIKESGKS